MGADPDAFGTGPSVDRSSEPWVARFPGLGVVRIDSDGGVDVEVSRETPDPDAVALALRHGWGEPLSYVRRGYHLLGATVVTAPGSSAAVLLTGTIGDVELFWLGLAHRGWGVLGERLVPVSCVRGVVLAHVRSAPPVATAAWARRAGLRADPLRSPTDAGVVVLDRPVRPCPIAAVAVIEGLHPGPSELRDIVGPARISAVAGVAAGVDPAMRPAVMPVVAGLAALPQVAMRPSRAQLADSIEVLAAWAITATAERPSA